MFKTTHLHQFYKVWFWCPPCQFNKSKLSTLFVINSQNNTETFSVPHQMLFCAHFDANPPNQIYFTSPRLSRCRPTQKPMSKCLNLSFWTFCTKTEQKDHWAQILDQKYMQCQSPACRQCLVFKFRFEQTTIWAIQITQTLFEEANFQFVKIVWINWNWQVNDTQVKTLEQDLLFNWKASCGVALFSRRFDSWFQFTSFNLLFSRVKALYSEVCCLIQFSRSL